MFSRETYKTEGDVASYIARAVAKQRGYISADIYTSPILPEAQLVKLSGNKPSGYLNLFVIPSEDMANWKVSAIGIIVEDSCFSELTEEEATKMWKFGTSYVYDHVGVSLCDVTNVDINTLCSYVSEDASPDRIIIDRAVIAKRKTVSGIIHSWFEIENSIKNVTDASSEEMKQLAATSNIRTEVVEVIVSKCMDANRCVKKHIAYNGSGTDLKVTASLLTVDNRVYELYLCVDEVHSGLFYLAFENGQWKKKLLPDSIADVAALFKEKTR